MILFSNLYDANRNLWRNKLRSILTILAITVGSFAIIISLAIQTGTKSFIDDQFSALGGDNILSIFPQSTLDTVENMVTNEIEEYSEEEDNKIFSGITEEQIKKVKAINGIKSSSVKPVVYYYVDYITSSLTEKKYRIDVDDLSASSLNIALSAGSDLQQSSQEHQILLPPEYVEKLGFQDAATAIGQTVTLAIAQSQVQTPPEVEQETENSENTSDQQGSEDESQNEDQTNAEQPETPAQPSATQKAKFTELTATIAGVRKDSIFSLPGGYAIVNDALAKAIHAENEKDTPTDQRDKVFNLVAELEDGANIDQIKTDLSQLDLTASTKTEAVEEIHSFLDVVTIVLYIFGGIALLVASIGIINTLLMSVQERTKEIGLNKALGMSSFRIFSIFSLESILLGFWGSAIGTVVAYAVGKIGDQLLHREGQLLANFPDFHIVKFTMLNILIVIAIVMIIAFIAGTLPAVRAARKNPIRSLRHE